MIKYNGRWLYPPRPKLAVPPKELERWDNMNYIAQAKLNGSCGMVITNGKEAILKNRHQGQFANFSINTEVMCSMHRGSDWMVLIGEFLTKSKKFEGHNNFNRKFIIFDIIAHNGKVLVNHTTEERLNILNNLYSISPQTKWFSEVNEHFSLIQSHSSDFINLWDLAQPDDLIEGLVLKKRDAKLKNPISDSINSNWQMKFRKPTKNYNF